MAIPKDKYYNYNRLLSHNAMYSFILSNRGNGKSWGLKRLIITNKLKHGKESCYIRRTKTELDEAKQTFWADIKDHYPDHEFTVKGSKGYIDGEIAVHFMAFSVAGKLRSTSYPNVTLIAYDEYVIETSRYNNYIKNEENLVMSLNETIIRDREGVRVLFLGNCVSFVNPIFTCFDIEPEPGKQFQKFLDGLIVLEHLNDTAFAEEKKKTKHGKLMMKSRYGKYAIDNEILEDTSDFIAKSRGNGNWGYNMVLRSKGFSIAVWLEYLSDTFYIDKDIRNGSIPKYTILNDDNESGFKHIKSARTTDWRIKLLKKSYYEGKVYYVNQEVKKFFINNVAPYL